MSKKSPEDVDEKSDKENISKPDIFKVGENHSYKIRHEGHGH